ncbi:type IX secretion system protein PorG [Sphingobacterium wenxiniae]|uniref:Outer membrane protein beta-barrel domain-containing protein n=1 Tax=Sphingobacterium wenxiniae TaxID=683125 RepID=A0A1I6P737_9SPHI|nr:DUF6089 family protein [Sphingobacterium wenxiniae]SFS35965.1 Outer membrane protein beta-barrel domain-containing protein [Sphingobacterium wenxiniae]
MKRVSYILIIYVLCSIHTVSAQQWEIGINAGATGFMGDINPTNPFYFKSAGGGLFVKHNFNPTWGVQAFFNYLHLAGSDKDDKDPYRNSRGRVFNNQVKEFGVRADFNFFKFIPGRQVYRYTPYLFAGVAGVRHSPYILSGGTRYEPEEVKLQASDSVSTKIQKTAISIPFGVGFKYNIKGPWSIGAEVGYRLAFNDQLDNIYDNYPTSSVIPNGVQPELHEISQNGNSLWQNMAFPRGNAADYAGKPIGNGRAFDGYMTAGVTLTFTFISKKCYWWN